ncbi:MAG TPA: hypothetical protein VGF94_19290 [Kofleriaceae bacterium]
MTKGGFWDFQDYWQTVTSSSFWFDSEWKQRRDINNLEIAESEVQYEVGSLGVALGQIQKQMLELSMTVVVMSQVLHEAGALDVPKLQARIDAELEKLRPKPKPQQPQVVVAHPTKAKPPDTQVPCQRCGASVPSSRTTITERYGTVCDDCAERA